MSRSIRLVAPAQAEAHTVLRREAVQAGFSEDTVRDLAWLLNAPCHLMALPRICENLLEMLKQIPKQWRMPLSDLGLTAWPALLQWIVESRHELSAQIKTPGIFDGAPRLNGSSPLLGACAKRNPLYTSVWERHPDPQRQPLYCLLQTHFTVAHLLALRQHSKRDDYEQYAGAAEWRVLPNSPYPASKAVRALARDRWASFLDGCPVQKSPDEFVDAFAALSPPNDVKLLSTHKALSCFLQYASLGQWRRRQVQRNGAEETSKGGGEGRGPATKKIDRWEIELGDHDAPDEGGAKVTLLSEHPLSEEEEKEWLDADVCPAEEQEETLLCFDYQPDETDHDGKEDEPGWPERPPSQPRDPGNVLEVAKAQIKHVACANQLLPWARGTLSTGELAALSGRCLTWLQSLPKEGELSLAELDRLEEIALLHIMLFTGSSLKRALQLRVFPAGTRNADAEFALFLPQQADQAPNWRLRALRPPYQSEQAEVPGQQRELSDFVSLPDVAGGNYFLRRLFRERRRLRVSHDNRAGAPLRVSRGGEQTERDYRRRLKQLLRELGPNGRLTLHHISNWLFRAVVTATGGDVVAASLLSGKRHFLAKVRGFYACESLPRLQRVYAEVVSAAAHMRMTIGPDNMPLGFYPPPTEVSFSEPHHYIGCRLAPTRKAVTEAIAGLLRSLKAAANYRDRAGWIHYHNLYTLYSVWTFAFASGMRGVVSPYLSPARVHAPSGFASLTDKDNGSGYKTRLLWTPPFVFGQMQLYEDHLTVVREQSKEPTAALSEPCFFLSEGLRAVEVRPHTLRAQMDPYLPFPVNVHRRFVRSELLERDCPPEVVDAWMGHWHRGEEPWGELSSFSPVYYRQALERYLVPLLRELGFHSLPSCFV